MKCFLPYHRMRRVSLDFQQFMRTLQGQYFNHMRWHITVYQSPKRKKCGLNFLPAFQKNFTLRVLLMREMS